LDLFPNTGKIQLKKKSKNIRMRKNPTPGDTIIKEEEEEEGCEWN
jgi:hypothetical protein